jgi:hypothetical protein
LEDKIDRHSADENAEEQAEPASAAGFVILFRLTEALL